MKFKQTAIYVFVLAVLFVAFKYIQNTRKDGYKVKSTPVQYDFKALSADTSASVEIKKGTDTVTLRKENNSWKIVEKFFYDADSETVNAMFDTLKNLTLTEVVSKNPGKKSVFDLDTGGVSVVIKDDSQKEKLSMTVGKIARDWSSNYFAVKGSDYVYQSKTYLNATVKTRAADFIKKSLYTVKGDEIERIHIVYGTKEVEAVMGNGWQLLKPVEGPADAEKIKALCNAAANLKIDDVIGKGTDKKYGFDTAEITVQFTTIDKTEYTVKVGGFTAANKNKRYLMLEGSDFIFEVPKYALTGLEPSAEAMTVKEPEPASAETMPQPVITPDVNKQEESMSDTNDNLGYAAPAQCSDTENPQVAIITSKGTMEFELFENDAPNTVKNFINLAEKKFYDGLKFHRVIADFMAQGGCPYSRPGSDGMPGTGGPGYTIKCEINPNKHLRGSLSMAHAGKDTGGSQFFICFKPQPHLDGKHTVFGKMLKGDDVLSKITQNDDIKGVRVIRKRNHEYVPVTSPK